MELCAQVQLHAICVSGACGRVQLQAACASGALCASTLCLCAKLHSQECMCVHHSHKWRCARACHSPSHAKLETLGTTGLVSYSFILCAIFFHSPNGCHASLPVSMCSFTELFCLLSPFLNIGDSLFKFSVIVFLPVLQQVGTNTTSILQVTETWYHEEDKIAPDSFLNISRSLWEEIYHFMYLYL